MLWNLTMNMSSSRSGSKFGRAVEFLRQDQVKKTNWIGSSKSNKKMSRFVTKNNLSLMMMMLSSKLIMKKTKKDEVENLQSQH